MNLEKEIDQDQKDELLSSLQVTHLLPYDQIHSLLSIPFNRSSSTDPIHPHPPHPSDRRITP